MIAYDYEFGRTEGERRKTEQLALLEAHRDSFVNRGRRALLSKLLQAGTATADDVRRAVELPEGIDPRCLGSVPGPLAKAGIIRRADFAKSGRPERHASFIAVWQLIDAEAARRWLQFHPDIPPDDAEGICNRVPVAPKKPSPTAATVGLVGSAN